MKTPCISLLLIIFLFACQQEDSNKDFLINKEKALNKSIYANFKMGDNEWYLTNPKDSVQLYMFEWGVGKDTVVVLHGGFGAEHRYLKDAFEGLYDQYHFVFYDQRGSLRSPCPVEKISIQDHVSDLEAIRKELGLEQLNLFGHSNGTTLATYYLREHPNKVKGFVMTACMLMEYPIKESDTVLKNIEIKSYENFGDYIERPEVKEAIAKVERDSSLPPSKKKYQIESINMAKYYIYNISKWKEGKESRGAFMNYTAGSAVTKSIQGKYSNIELYKNHPYPITIIMGEKDMIDPGGGKFTYWTKELSDVHHILIEKAAHDPWIDQPEKFKTTFIEAMNRYQ